MVLLHSTDGKVIECKGGLSELEAAIKDKGFLRLQRSFLANMRYILTMKKLQCRFEGWNYAQNLGTELF